MFGSCWFLEDEAHIRLSAVLELFGISNVAYNGMVSYLLSPASNVTQGMSFG